MLKKIWEKAKKTRCRLLLVSSAFVLLSIPLALISTKIMAFAITFWVAVVFFKLFEDMKISKVTVNDFDEQAKKDFKDGKTVKGFVNFFVPRVALPLGIMVLIMELLVLWIC